MGVWWEEVPEQALLQALTAPAQLPPWEGSKLPPAPQPMGGASGEPQLLPVR